VVRVMPIARQRVAKHIPAEANARNNSTFIARQRPQYAGNNRITSVAMQRAVNTTIEEEVFSMWFAYIHCWTTDVFSMGPSRDYISGTEPKDSKIWSRVPRGLGPQNDCAGEGQQ
jgi:hypothetical protein